MEPTAPVAELSELPPPSAPPPPGVGDRTARRGLLLLAGIGLLTILLPLWVDSWVSFYSGELLRLRTGCEALAADTTEANWLTADLDRLAEPSRIARQTHANCALWFDLLRDLRDRLPQELWLTSLSIAQPTGTNGGTREVQLSGAAARQEAIASYLIAVGESPWIETAEFVESKEATGKEADQPLEFTFHLTLKRPLPLPDEQEVQP